MGCWGRGARGGADGAVNEVRVVRSGEAYTPEHLSKEQDIPLVSGDRVHVKTPGGGGYGAAQDEDMEVEVVANGAKVGKKRKLFAERGSVFEYQQQQHSA